MVTTLRQRWYGREANLRTRHGGSRKGTSVRKWGAATFGSEDEFAPHYHEEVNCLLKASTFKFTLHNQIKDTGLLMCSHLSLTFTCLNPISIHLSKHFCLTIIIKYNE